ncbi:hypothetical protein [Oceaniferula spumae]
MDKGSKADIQKLWGINKRYYDFDLNGWKFIVVDMNNIKKDGQYIPYANANFYVNGSMRSWPDPEQLEWLDETLEKTNLPVLIYTHQPFAPPSAATSTTTGTVRSPALTIFVLTVLLISGKMASLGHTRMHFLPLWKSRAAG